MSDPIIDPVYAEWWKRGSIVTTSPQHTRDCESAFYAGVYVAMGLIARVNKMPEIDAERMVSDMIRECEHKLMEKKVKFSASINGERIDPRN